MLHELSIDYVKMSEYSNKEICNLNLHRIRHDYDKLVYENGSYFITDIERQMYLKYGDLWYQAKSYNNNYFQKKNRLNKRIKNIIDNISDDNIAYFLTLTFNDEVLTSTSKVTRRRYVSRFCKDNFIDYVANIDYGTLNEREHYHAVVLSENIVKWNYGFYNYRKIRITDNDKKRISKYLTKLTNHAMKVYGKCDRLIFSRKKRKD